MAIRNVAIIGAGVSGVSAAIHLSKAGLNVCVYERTKRIGGVWVFDEEVAEDPPYPSVNPSFGDTRENLLRKQYANNELESDRGDLTRLHAPPGPCYIGLKNNVSMFEMEMQTMPWQTNAEEFVLHHHLAEYIDAAAKVNGVYDSIRMGTRVNEVSKEAGKWCIDSTELCETGKHERIQHQKEAYDAVVIAVGHYHACHIPDIPGLADWKVAHPDRVMHSKQYRRADAFRGKNVLLVGAGVSSMDIAKGLGPIARSIIQVSRGGQFDLPSSMLPANASRVGAIRSFDRLRRDSAKEDHAKKPHQKIPGIVTLESGDVLCDIDHVILCTGYHVSLPFLRSLHADGVKAADADDFVLVTDGQQTHNLHKDIFYIPDPSLAFIGVPYHVATFSLFEFQAMALAAVWAGQARLPTQEDMRTEYRARTDIKGAGRTFHSLRAQGDEDAYVEELVSLANGGAGSISLVKMVGHTERWHEAYQRRLKRAGSVRSRIRTSSEERRARELLPSCV